MEDIHFCHITDSHLGNRQYGLLERFDDFAHSLLDAVEKSIALAPQFIIYSGDLFDHSKPQAAELRQAVRIFKHLKKAHIPLFLTQGNHDISYSHSKRYGGDILSFLSDFGLFTYIQDEITWVEIEGQKKALILGVNYYGKRTDRVLEKLLQLYKDDLQFSGPKILMLHAFVEGMPGEKDVSVETIARGNFDYVAVGHLHERWENHDAKIYCPGSTEHTSSAEWKQPKLGFYDAHLRKNGSTWKLENNFIEIKTRPKCTFVHELSSNSVPEIREEAEIFLKKHDIPGAVLRVIFNGSYKGKEHPFVDLNHYRKIPQKTLYTIIISNFLEAQKKRPETINFSKREAYEKVLTDEFDISPQELTDFVSLIEDSLAIVSSGSANEQEETLNERFDKFAQEKTNKEDSTA